MPSALPELYQYAHVPETQEDLDWADRKQLTVHTNKHKQPHTNTTQTLYKPAR